MMLQGCPVLRKGVRLLSPGTGRNLPALVGSLAAGQLWEGVEKLVSHRVASSPWLC